MVQSTTSRRATKGASDDLPEERSHGYFSTLVETVFPLDEQSLSARTKGREELAGLSVQDLLAAYACMRLSREIDKMETLLHRSGNLWFSIAGAGKEALNVAVGMHLRRDDIKLPYYRDHALALWSGITMLDLLRQGTASRFDPMSGGRQMTSHFGSVELNYPTGSTMTGSQCLPAAGRAEALLLEAKLGTKVSESLPDTIVYTSLGDGTTSEGEVEEAIRDAVRTMAPLMIVIEDDEWAISTPIETNVPGGDIPRLYRQYEHIGPKNHLEIMSVDGTDFIATYRAAQEAVDYLRARKGPVLFHARVTRPLSHSSADTQAYYRNSADLAAEEARDPLVRMTVLLAGYEFPAEKLAELDALIFREVRQAANTATAEPKADPATILDHITESPLIVEMDVPHPADVPPHPSPPDAERIPMRDMINRVLIEEMARDERIIIFGQDVADFPQPEHHEGLKGKGGVFHVTRGIGAAYPGRVWNSPLAEATILGTAMGYSLGGWLPVIEIQFRDYIHPGWQQLVDEIATLRWRSNGTFGCPMVIRVAYGDYLGGAGAIWHSEAAVGPIAHYPGLRVVVPSNAADAAGLLREAMVCGDPVVFLECKSQYESHPARSPYPGADYRVPLGSARVHQEGDDLTIVSYGNLLPRSTVAAQRLEDEYAVSCEIIDLRTVDAGYDRAAVLASIKKTGRLLVADEDRPVGGFGSSVIADFATQASHLLKSPIGRVTPKFTRVSYGPAGEKAIMPSPDTVFDEAKRILGL
ncbi:MAG: alpha-ketoacid dehydrogenase subunit alpha/beta [Chloroflexia bacterium]